MIPFTLALFLINGGMISKHKAWTPVKARKPKSRLVAAFERSEEPASKDAIKGSRASALR